MKNCKFIQILLYITIIQSVDLFTYFRIPKIKSFSFYVHTINEMHNILLIYLIKNIC